MKVIRESYRPGESWPFFVTLERGEGIRGYYRIDYEALLDLAEELEWRYDAAASPGELGYVNAGEIMECASRIRDALGVGDV